MSQNNANKKARLIKFFSRFLINPTCEIVGSRKSNRWITLARAERWRKRRGRTRRFLRKTRWSKVGSDCVLILFRTEECMCECVCVVGCPRTAECKLFQLLTYALIRLQHTQQINFGAILGLFFFCFLLLLLFFFFFFLFAFFVCFPFCCFAHFVSRNSQKGPAHHHSSHSLVFHLSLLFVCIMVHPPTLGKTAPFFVSWRPKWASISNVFKHVEMKNTNKKFSHGNSKQINANWWRKQQKKNFIWSY